MSDITLPEDGVLGGLLLVGSSEGEDDSGGCSLASTADLSEASLSAADAPSVVDD